MNSENQKTNVENWYTQNGEHYIASFGEEYEQHFTGEKNTDGGCAILTNQHCYLQGKYLLTPKKKGESYSADEKIPLNKMVKCGIRYSPLTILLICFFLIGWGIFLGLCCVSLCEFPYRKNDKEDAEYRLAVEEPIKRYEEKIDEYNRLIEHIINDITENGANASCVYFLSENEDIYDVELSRTNDIKVCIKQWAYNSEAITDVYCISKFGEYRKGYNMPILQYSSSNEENVWGYNSTYGINIAAEHQRQLDKYFSDPESVNILAYPLEIRYTYYLDEYFRDLFNGSNPRYHSGDLDGFEGIEEEITKYEERLQDNIKECTEDLWRHKVECFVYIAFVVIISFLIIPFLVCKLLKTKFFYIVYRTDTLDNKKLYLWLKKGLYREVKLFSSKLEKAKNMKDNSVPTTEQATSKSSENSTVSSQPDDLRKYAELLRDGVITQEEFDAMKQKILGL